MSPEFPNVPAGSGKHPIQLVAISANALAASTAFYADAFGWRVMPMGSELAGVMTPWGPGAALRAGNPEGFPGAVPFIAVEDVDAALAKVVAAGGSVEKEPWSVPMVGKLARFKDPWGTIYGLTVASAPGSSPHIPMPFGSNPKPPAGTICSVEMYAGDGEAAAKFFGGLFGWGTLATMPQYMAFDPGAGPGGVFQSHTPQLPAMPYVYAADVPAKLVEIVAAGGEKVGEPMAMPGMGTFGYFKDPSGTHMGLIGS